MVHDHTTIWLSVPLAKSLMLTAIYHGQLVRLAANSFVKSSVQRHLTTDSEILMVVAPAAVLTRP